MYLTNSPINYFGNRGIDVLSICEHFLVGQKFNRIFEPFCGSASFSLCAMSLELGQKYIISDSYQPLIETLLAFKDASTAIIQSYEKHLNTLLSLPTYAAKSNYYESVKRDFNQHQALPDARAHFLFLTNFAKYHLPIIDASGFASEFGPQPNSAVSPQTIKEQLLEFATFCKRNPVEIHLATFDKLLVDTNANDLVFLDPPYPDLPESPAIYHRPESRAELHQKLVDAITSLNQRGTPFVLFYGLYTGDHPYHLDAEKLNLQHWIHMGTDRHGLFNEYLENFYVSSNLALPANTPTIHANMINSKFIKDKTPLEVISQIKLLKALSIDYNSPQMNSLTMQSITCEGRLVKITLKEREVLEYLKKGYSAKQIALELKSSPRTVEIHLENLKKKTYCQSKSELVAKAQIQY